jgi:hypothetical protein
VKSILIETVNNEELTLVEAFIKEHKLKGFVVQESKATEPDVLNDIVRMLIPIL